jgi:aryl-alcohol dehydrogenase-like predicted oxidoreductase
MSERPKELQDSIDATKVSYAQVGKSGLKVSIPILGAMSFGHKDWQPWVVDDVEEGTQLSTADCLVGSPANELKVNTLLKGAYDKGLNTWDTANVYSNGASEEMIGNAIKKFKFPREKLIILTKCFGTVGETPGVRHITFPEMKVTKDYVNQGGLSRAAIFNAVNASLKRLQLDYIDLLQIHRFDATVPVEETMKALHDLVEQGKVRYIGASSMWAYQFQKLQNVAEKNGWTK